MLRWAGSFTLVLVLFLITAAVVNLVPPPSLSGSNLATCPTTMLGLEGADVPIGEIVLDELDPTEMIMRTYKGPHPQEVVWLVIAYFENSRYGAHAPEVCYLSSGWATEPRPDHVFERDGRPPVVAKVFKVLRRGEARLVLHFYYISEDKIMGTQRRFLDSMALQGIIRGSNYGSFVRVSTPVWPSQEEADARLHEFTRELLAVMPSLFPGEQEKGR